MPDSLTKEQAYKAMYAFLKNWYSMTNSDDIGSLLGSMSKLEEGGTADPAIEEDWAEAVNQALQGAVDDKLRLR